MLVYLKALFQIYYVDIYPKYFENEASIWTWPTYLPISHYGQTFLTGHHFFTNHFMHVLFVNLKLQLILSQINKNVLNNNQITMFTQRNKTEMKLYDLIGLCYFTINDPTIRDSTMLDSHVTYAFLCKRGNSLHCIKSSKDNSNWFCLRSLEVKCRKS